MEIISDIIKTTLENFDFAYCITVNILTYLIIMFTMRKINKCRNSVWIKRVILIIVIIIVGIVYYRLDGNGKVLINSAVLAPVFWSWVMKPICNYFKIDYKQLDLFN